MERERRGLFGVESNATLPADWKHHEPRKDSGVCEASLVSFRDVQSNMRLDYHKFVGLIFQAARYSSPEIKPAEGVLIHHNNK